MTTAINTKINLVSFDNYRGILIRNRKKEVAAVIIWNQIGVYETVVIIPSLENEWHNRMPKDLQQSMRFIHFQLRDGIFFQGQDSSSKRTFIPGASFFHMGSWNVLEDEVLERKMNVWSLFERD